MRGYPSLPFSYDYNLAGGMKSETYPSGRTVTTGFDAMSRPVSVNGIFQSTPTTYVTSAQYASNGALSNIGFGVTGSGISQTVVFDGGTNTLRGQPTEVAATAGGNFVRSLNYT
jgi:hypothetical protein